MAKGKFIVFEGLDGSGQSTQADLLQKYLDAKGFSVVITKEPTKDSEAGLKISEVLNHRIATTPQDLQKLFSVDRKNHVESFIVPALQEGKIVISDRYFFSSLAFGSIDCDLVWLIDLNKDFPNPDLTFILDVRAEESVRRINERGKPVQFFEVKEKLEKVRENYQKIAPMFPSIHLINGERSIEAIHQEIVELVSKIL